MGTRPSVSIYLLITLGVLSAIPVALLGNFVARERAREATVSFDVQSVNIAENVVDEISSLLKTKAEVLGVIAGTVEAAGDVSTERLQLLLHAQHGASGSFDTVYIGDESGRSLAVAPERNAEGLRMRAGVDYSDRDYFIEARKTEAVAYSQVQLGRQSRVANVMIGVPYFRPTEQREWDVEFAGIVAAGVRLSLIASLTARLVAAADGGRAIVLDGNRHVLVDTFQRVAPLTFLGSDTIYAQECTTTAQTGIDDAGVAVRAVCAPLKIGTQHWMVWVSIPEALLVAEATKAHRSTLRAALSSLAVAFLVSMGFVLYTRRAFSQFGAVVEQVASGDLAVRLPQPGAVAPREIVELFSALDQSIARIQHSESENQRLLAELRETNAREAPLAAVWNQIGDAAELLDTDGRILFVNPAHERLYGVKADDVVGRLSGLFTGEELPAEGEAPTPYGVRQALAGGGSLSLTVRRKALQGDLELHVSVSPVLNIDSHLEQIAVVRRDLTTLRQSQRAAAHSERLASVGTLAAGLAHEINNPLTYIKCGLEDLIEDAKRATPSLSADERLERASEALQGVGRVETIVRSLLHLSRDGSAGAPTSTVAVDLGQVVASAVALASPQLRQKAQLHIEMPSGLTTKGRPSELVQVVLNLLINAGQAMPQGEAAQRFVRVKGGRSSAGGKVYIDVTDNGPGIAHDKLERIFDPFYTTKGVGEGSGLGLSISSGIAKAHGGSLDACSTPGDGTVFRLELPWVEIEEQAGRSLVPSMDQRPILLVDDDVLVSRILARMLGQSRVHVVHSVDEAVGLIDHCPGFKAILSDVRMPGRTGIDLYDHLSRHHNVLSQRMVFMTGGAGEEHLAARLASTGRPVLSKPFDRATLQRALEPLLTA